MSHGIIRQLNSLKSGEINPRADWVSKNRGILLSQIRNTVDPAVERKQPSRNVWDTMSIIFSPRLVNHALRPMVILLIVSLVGTSGWIATVDAAYEALPGDMLYTAKRAVEKTQVAVVKVIGDQKTETKLHSEFANRRAKEVKRIVVGTDPKKTAMVTDTLNDLKKELKSVDTKLDTNVSADVVNDVRQNAEEIKVTLKEVKDNLLVEHGNNNLTQEVADAKEAVKKTEIKAVETMVEKHLNGDTSMTKEEVKEVINSTIKNVAVEAVENKQNAADAKKVVEAVKTEVRDLAKDPIISGEMASGTKALNDKMTVMAAEAKDASAKTDVIAKEVDKTVVEANALLSSGDLTQAVSKMKEASANTTKAEAITDKTISNMQNVLPVMGVVVKSGVIVSAVATSTNNLVIVVSTTPALNIGIVSTTPAVPSALAPSAAIIVSSTVIKK